MMPNLSSTIYSKRITIVQDKYKIEEAECGEKFVNFFCGRKQEEL